MLINQELQRQGVSFLKAFLWNKFHSEIIQLPLQLLLASPVLNWWKWLKLLGGSYYYQV